MKHTAVEWLEDELIRVGFFEDMKPNITFEQAKEMEKQQIIDAYDVKWVEYIIDGKDYYNETFKKK